MARTTIAQAIVNLRDWTRIAHDSVLTDVAGWITDIRTAQGNLESDRLKLPGAGVMAGARSVWESLKPEGIAVFADMARSSAVNAPPDVTSAGFRAVMQWIRDYFSDDGAFSGGSIDAYFTSRDYTRGSGTNVTGTRVYSTLTDRRGLARQNGHAETYRVRVTSTGSAREKTITISGLPRGDEPYEQLGSGTTIRITLFDVNAPAGGGAGQVLTNPVLLPQETTDAASVTSINGWTLPATCDWKVESTAADLFGRQTTVLKSSGTTVANHTLTQSLTKKLNTENPYCVGFWARNSGSFEGAIQIAQGSKSQSFTHAVFDSTNWTPFVCDMDKDLFVDNFDADDMTVVVSVPTITTGTFELGSAFMIEMVYAEGTGRHFAGLADDTGPLYAATGIYATDSIGGSEGDYAQTISYHYDEYLPGAGSNLQAEPT